MLLTLLCLFLTLPAAASEWRVVSSEPGNVFFEGSPVLFRVEAKKADTPLRFRLTDYDGKTRMEGEVSGSEIRVSRGICPPGYYELVATDGARSIKTPFVVVRKPCARRTDRLAVDAAHSWLIPPERFEEGAEMLRRAGFGWARERLSWGEVEPERGIFRWGKYDRSAEAARKRGIRISQVFHHTPAWARSDREGMRFPDDLRDIYRFCKTAAEHYKGSVQAWEVWNESDIPVFSPEPGSDYAAFLKAAYLGFKAGDPDVLVTQVSLALASPCYHESLYKNGTAAYFDIFNYHIYDAPRNYPARARGHFSIMDRFAAPAVPIWLTEAGIPLRAVNNTLTSEDKRRQAEFIPKSFVMSLVSGTDRHFFFVFPHYLENGVEFGVMDADLKPYPGYAALATVTAILGEARYRGRLRLPDAPEVEARLFDNGRDETLVIWSDQKPAEVRLPVDASKARVINCVGTQQQAERATEVGLLLKVGSAPLYVQASRGSFPDVMDDTVRRAAKPAPTLYAGHDLVVRVIPPKETFRKGRERYEFPAGQTVRLQVEAYNFGKQARTGTIHLRAPAGWTLRPDRFEGTFAPMGREVFLATLTVPENPGLQAQEIEAAIRPREGETWGAGRPQSAPAVIDIAVDPNSPGATSE